MLPKLPSRIKALIKKRDYSVQPPTHRVIISRFVGKRNKQLSFRINAGDDSLLKTSSHIFALVEKALPILLVSEVSDFKKQKSTHRIIVREQQNGRDGISKQRDFRFMSHSSMEIGITLERLLCNGYSTLEQSCRGEQSHE